MKAKSHVSDTIFLRRVIMNFIGEMDLRDSQRFNNYHRVNLSHVGVIGVIENGWISDRYQVIRY